MGIFAICLVALLLIFGPGWVQRRVLGAWARLLHLLLEHEVQARKQAAEANLSTSSWQELYCRYQNLRGNQAAWTVGECITLLNGRPGTEHLLGVLAELACVESGVPSIAQRELILACANALGEPRAKTDEQLRTFMFAKLGNAIVYLAVKAAQTSGKFSTDNPLALAGDPFVGGLTPVTKRTLVSVCSQMSGGEDQAVRAVDAGIKTLDRPELIPAIVHMILGSSSCETSLERWTVVREWLTSCLWPHSSNAFREATVGYMKGSLDTIGNSWRSNADGQASGDYHRTADPAHEVPDAVPAPVYDPRVDLRELDLGNCATLKDVQKAYRRLAKELHPDILATKGIGRESVQAAEVRFKVVSACYARLCVFFRGR